MTYAFDPELAAVIPLLPVVDLTDLAATRTSQAELLTQLPVPERETAVDVRDVYVPGPEGAPDVMLRIFAPRDHSGPLPAIFDMHGGGFVLGSVDLDDQRNKELCEGIGAVVVSVEYRLAPEHPFPAGLEDCYAGLVWLAEHADELGVDVSRIALFGISAGGGLAAALALLARDRGGPAIAFQYLGVPEVDDRLQTPSMRAFTDTPLWNYPRAVFSWDAYLGEGRRGTDDVSPYAAPARATDLSGLPPAYVSAMEFDPLRDESIAYALALLAAGVSVELHLFPGTFHGSGLVWTAEVSKREAAEGLAVLRKALRV
ncbi:alpha/beta hydrolase [Cryptosporangium aurantiacum]|uniref:Acetyl esterase/lipase n=1 Tax=Cryptosporangium aurantiacum TaxID=134849 RepID=A0A1M7H1R4_9ACTN|nr:alpha/beta hydrolase [Cryptosporangium aurantiacum]SHM22323.1 Acetyl esterase/lipase [Cryptosporangium aurantiacum]